MTKRLLQMLDRLMDSKPCDRTFVVEVRPIKGFQNPLTERLLQRLDGLMDSKLCDRTLVVEVRPINGFQTL